jgi:polysaccharide pyruvyl transferase WcaK-like protein
MRQIAETDVVVATRFHNVVCALKLGRPTVSIGYAKKNDVLLAETGLGEFCQSIETLDVDRLIRQFQALLSDRDRYERIVRETNLAREKHLRHQEEILLTQVLPHPSAG